MNHQKIPLAVLVVLLAFAFGLRIWGIAWGQPVVDYAPTYAPMGMIHDQTPLHPDEFLFVALPFKMALTGDLNPHFFENPSFLINLNWALNKLTGLDNGYTMSQREGFNDRNVAPFSAYVMGRVMSALGGLLTVVGVYGLVRKLAGHYAGMVALLLTSISLPLVQHAHYSTTSSLATGFAVLSLWFGANALQRQQVRWLTLASCALGLAVGNRYNVGVYALGVVLVGMVLAWRTRRFKTWAMIATAWAFFPITFLLTTPYALLDFEKFTADLRYISNQYLGAGNGVMIFPSAQGFLLLWQYVIIFGVGVVALSVALFGLMRLRTLTVTARWILLCVLVIALSYSVSVMRTIRPIGADQLVLPVIPLIIILCGVGLQTVLSLLKRSWMRVVLVGIMVIMPIYHTLMVVAQMSAPDNRQLMQAWVYTNLPYQTSVRLVGNNNVALDPQNYRTEQLFDPIELLDWATLPPTDYLIVSDAIALQRSKFGIVAPTHLPPNAQLLARVFRPPVFGFDWAVYTASYWHNPTLSVYCLNVIACNATIR